MRWQPCWWIMLLNFLWMLRCLLLRKQRGSEWWGSEPPPWPDNQSASSRSRSRSMGHWRLTGLALLYSPTALLLHISFFFSSIFSSPVKFFESHLRSKTFTYGSRLWGQVVVSLGETSLCCCCCWKVRLFITLLSGWSLKPFKGLTGKRFISKIRNSELIFPLILSLFEICISCHLEHPHVCLSLSNVIQQELKYTE